MTSSATFTAQTLDSLLSDPGHPRLTWYGGEFERIELSSAVVGNWVNKTTNLLVEEFDAEPSVDIAIDLPAHWRQLVWTLAALRTGCTVHLGSQRGLDAGVEALITDRPQDAGEFARTGELVAVALPALARRFDGELPAGAIDAASAVMTYSDAIGFVSITDPLLPALVEGETTLTYGELPEWAAAAPVPAGQRVALVCTRANAPLLPLIQHVLGIYAGDGSVVLIGPAAAQELSDDSARFQRIVDSERITTVIEL